MKWVYVKCGISGDNEARYEVVVILVITNSLSISRLSKGGGKGQLE